MNSPSDAGAIVFVGPMGSGKTSIGKKVARALRRSFTDTDQVIVAAHGPIPAIFESQGEPAFREIEKDAVREALSRGGVVALGGGAVLAPETRQALAAHRVVLLTVEPRVVRGRLREGTRPLLAGDDGADAWTRIAESRRAFYDEVADVRFDTSRGPIQDIVQKIVEWAGSDTVAEEKTP
jgi:shikimate kinase